jgi:hypothetical protein
MGERQEKTDNERMRGPLCDVSAGSEIDSDLTVQ